MTEESDKFSTQEAKRRVDEALKRALATPPQPRKKPNDGEQEALLEPRLSEERDS